MTDQWPELWSECVKDAAAQGCTPEWLLWMRSRAPLEQRIAELERERDEAMERAARVCDDFSDAHRGDRKTVGQVYSPIAEALDRCAAAIRKLKGGTT